MEKCGGGCLKQCLKSILEGRRLEGMEWSGGGLLSGAEFREYIEGEEAGRNGVQRRIGEWGRV